MIALASITSEVKTLLEAADYLSGLTVEVDLGSKATETAIATALRSDGVAFQIAPVLRLAAKDLGKAKGLFEAAVMVRLLFNTEANDASGGAGKNIYSLLAAAVAAMLGYQPTNPNDRFRLAEETALLSSADPGLIIYDLHFVKPVIL